MQIDPAQIEAPRLRFRLLTPDDAEPWEEFLRHDEAVKFLPPFNDVKQAAKDWMARAENRYRNEGSGLYALIEKSTGTLIGQCGFLRQEVDGVLETEIGYHLIPGFWHRGFATEAATACRDFAFRNHLADFIISIIDVRNTPSVKVAMRNGMVFIRRTAWKGTAVSIYGISREQWLSLSA